MLRGNVLITGGAGFLGRGIMRRAEIENWPCNFTVYSRDEQKQELCKRKHPDANYVLGDVLDTDRLSLAMRRHDVVIHAAALKYVPEAEFNVNQCIAVNIDGTRSVISAVRAAKVPRAVLISTDKACAPINMYGLSKAVAERLWMEASRDWDDTTFVACRYGNVIGSTGSVVPLFKHQKATQGFVTVTDPTMTRFWLGIDSAVDIVDYSAHEATGRLVIPRCEAMPIGRLAQVVCGFDTDIRVVGARPGERKHERLMLLHESARSMPSRSYEHNELCEVIDWYGGVCNDAPQEYSSDVATAMLNDEFLRLADDAENV